MSGPYVNDSATSSGSGRAYGGTGQTYNITIDHATGNSSKSGTIDEKVDVGHVTGFAKSIGKIGSLDPTKVTFVNGPANASGNQVVFGGSGNTFSNAFFNKK
jgi:hypothetical protein